MTNVVDFHSQLASIMEVLANAAVAEICQLVDDGFASLRLEISRSQRENQTLKSTLRLMEVRLGEQPLREPSPLPPGVSCTRKDNYFGEDGSAVSKETAKCTPMENTDTEQSQPVVGTEQPLEPDVVVIKKERLEEELTGCRHGSCWSTAASDTAPPSLSLAAESDRPLSAEVGALSQYENQDFARPDTQQQPEKEGAAEAITVGRYCHPADQSHGATPRGSGPSRERTELAKEEYKHGVDPCDSLSLSAHSGCNKIPGVETPLIKTLDSELLLTHAEVKGVCGAAAVDRKLEAVPTAVKLEAEPSWSEAFGMPLVAISRNQCVSNSRLPTSNGPHTESETAELDTSSLDSSSFDDLFSSPEVARCLTAPHRGTGMEEPLSSASFPFLSSRSSFGNASMPDSLPVSSFSDTSSETRSRSLTGSVERTLSCQQCGRLFTTSRDLAVHQRSHAGERIYHCHLCKKPFVHPHQLKTHQRVHTGEKPFSCAQCGKRFSQSSHIKRHMSVHTGEKRYSCSLCGKRFSQACSLKVHQAVHTGERPYSCTKCGKKFSVLGNLVRHQSVHVSK